ncbi:restriction endonuclease subunit R, partial [Psychrobacter faecalis]
IDKVANYRGYTEDGVPVQGKFASWFEEEFIKQLKKPKYRVLYPSVWDKDDAGKSIINEQALKELASSVHDGYFAQDKKKDALGNPLFAESKLSAKGEGGKTIADESAYNLIMKDKEKLLSMNEKLRFIFSHSALKEGWDNPNVFQICTLNETKSETKKRQEVGRGLRLAVDQSGERVPYGFEVNTLTVMVNESYDQFVATFQKEIEEEEGIKFGVVEKHQFANIVISDEHNDKEFLGAKKSEEIYQHLESHGYINNKGKIQDSLKTDLADNTVVLPESVEEYAEAILATLTKVARGLSIKKHEEKKTAKLKEKEGKQVVLGDDFKALWDRIKYKTTYRVNFSVSELVEKCIKEIRASVVVSSVKYESKKRRVEIAESGLFVSDLDLEGKKVQDKQGVLEVNFKLPDIVTYLESQTNLTRSTIIHILLGLGDKLEAFKKNPQLFIQQCAEVIRKQMRLAIVDGISYQRIGDDNYYAQELFQEEELTGYLKNMVEAHKSVYDYIVCDSNTEFEFAEKLEQSAEVKL